MFGILLWVRRSGVVGVRAMRATTGREGYLGRGKSRALGGDAAMVA
jgi:hypothetical protein